MWDDAGVDWVRTKAALFRSTWDYFDRFAEFQRWFEQNEGNTQFIHSPELIKWNQNKSNLLDLLASEISIPRIIKLQKDYTFGQVMENQGWKRTIVKPFVSGAGLLTVLADAKNAAEMEEKIRPYLQQEDFMVQEYVETIVEKGEVSVIFFGNTFSHAVLKTAKPGDFRVQDDFYGTVKPFEASDPMIDFGRRCLQTCPSLPVYSRVDVMFGTNGEPILGELELVEPELWFRLFPNAAHRLADEVVQSRNNYPCFFPVVLNPLFHY